MKTQILVVGAILVLAHSARAQIFAPSVNVSNAPMQTFGSQQIFVDPAGNGAVGWEEVTGSDPNVRDAVAAVSPASVFAFRKSVNVSKAPTTVPSPRALIDRHLNMFVVWSSTALGGRKIVLGRSTDFGQSFTSQTVSDDFGFAPAHAEGPNGEIYVAWGKDADNDGLTDSILVIRSDDICRYSRGDSVCDKTARQPIYEVEAALADWMRRTMRKVEDGILLRIATGGYGTR